MHFVMFNLMWREICRESEFLPLSIGICGWSNGCFSGDMYHHPPCPLNLPPWSRLEQHHWHLHMQSPPAAWTVVRLRQAARKTITHQDARPKITVGEPENQGGLYDTTFGWYRMFLINSHIGVRIPLHLQPFRPLHKSDWIKSYETKNAF